MATCMYCNSQIEDGLKFCTNCGAALPVEAPLDQELQNASLQQPYQQPAYQQPQIQQPYQQPGAAPASAVQDSGSIGWVILGFFIPIVGLILFLVWKNTKPQCAKMAGIGAIVGFCLSVVVNMSFLR